MMAKPSLAPPPQTTPSRAWLLLAIGACFLLLAAGCRARGIGNVYGQRRGTLAGPSVNGTAVLSGMFDESGRRVRTWRRLSPMLNEFDTIVWFPDDFAPPSADRRSFLENWLSNGPARTLVYVGRDYDAAITYWKRIQPAAPPEQTMEVMRREATAQAEHDARRARMPKKEHADWFTLSRDEPHRKITTLAGPWSAGIDAAKVDIELAARLKIPSEAENDQWVARADNHWTGTPEFTTLLESEGDVSEGDVIVSQLTMPDWDDSRLLVVNNGSFLLNLPLVNHENRKLAGKLISTCAPGKAIFLESGVGGPLIFDKEPTANIPTGFQVFTVWPLGFIIMHLAILGMLCCIAIFPVFGRAREATPSGAISFADAALAGSAGTVIRADFGKHIEALGELLAMTEDRQYARNRVTYYHEHVRRDSGTSHRPAS